MIIDRIKLGPRFARTFKTQVEVEELKTHSRNFASLHANVSTAFLFCYGLGIRRKILLIYPSCYCFHLVVLFARIPHVTNKLSELVFLQFIVFFRRTGKLESNNNL